MKSLIRIYLELVVLNIILNKTFHSNAVCQSIAEGHLKCNFVSSEPDFGVSMAILNPVDIFRRWCRLNFGLLRAMLNHAISLQCY